MKKLLLGTLAILSLATLLPQDANAQRNGRKHCYCYELERRLEGLETVLDRARLSRTEERELRYQLDEAYYHYEKIDFRRTPYEEQAPICTEGNRAVDRSWSRWQPWLAERRWDPGNRCNNF